MKRVVCALLIFILISVNLTAFGFIYPTYEGANKNAVTYTERINIVFDNSGHENVKACFQDIMMASAIAENTKIWVYPIAGAEEPILVEPTKEFAEKYFNLYSKSSNEFKGENILEKAIIDLSDDATVTSKRIFLAADYQTEQIRKEYDLYNMRNYMDMYPDIQFASFFNGLSMAESSDYRNKKNFDYIQGKSIFTFLLLKNGYSLCEGTYNKENGILKIDKGKSGNNIAIYAKGDKTENVQVEKYKHETKPIDIYISGCMMDSEGYETYLSKSKVKGVALSYNNFSMEYDDKYYNCSMAVFTADGTTLNPLEEDIYIPVINADTVTVYYRNQKGAGVCSENTIYKTGQDKKILNAYAPFVETSDEEILKEETTATNKMSSLFTKTEKTEKTGGSVVKKIFSVIFGVIGTILSLALRLIKIAIFVLIILIIFVPKVRSYVQLKILSSKFAPYYEKLVVKIKKIISDIIGAGVKIKGATDMQGDYIFISKASADMGLPNNRVALVVKELEKRGIKCWLSETGIKAGDNYNAVLPVAIRSCKMFLLFISPMSVKSSDVVSEIGTAKEYKKPIVPVQIEQFDLFKMYPDWAYMLKQYQKTDLFSSKEDDIKAICDQIIEAYNKI